MEVYKYIQPNQKIDEEIARKATGKEWCHDFLNNIDINTPCFETFIKLAYIIDFCGDKKIKYDTRIIFEKWIQYYSQE